MKMPSTMQKLKWTAMGKKILNDMEKHPEKRKTLIKILRENGFEDIAIVAREIETWYFGG